MSKGMGNSFLLVSHAFSKEAKESQQVMLALSQIILVDGKVEF